MGQYVDRGRGERGLGYVTFGQNPSGKAGAYRWNTSAAAGGKRDVFPFQVKGKYRSAGDRQFALDIWALQHHDLRCAGSGRPDDASQPNCAGRDGLYGQQAQQMMINHILSRDALGQEWARNLTLDPRARAVGIQPLPDLDCRDVTCEQPFRRAAGCAPCGRPPRPRPDPDPDPEPQPKEAGMGLVVVGAALLAGAYFYKKNKAY